MNYSTHFVVVRIWCEWTFGILDMLTCRSDPSGNVECRRWNFPIIQSYIQKNSIIERKYEHEEFFLPICGWWRRVSESRVRLLSILVENEAYLHRKLKNDGSNWEWIKIKWNFFSKGREKWSEMLNNENEFSFILMFIFNVDKNAWKWSLLVQVPKWFFFSLL